MLRRHPGAWGPRRRAAFAAAPAVIGAALLLLTDDGPPVGTSRIEAGQTSSTLPPGVSIEAAATAGAVEAPAVAVLDDHGLSPASPPGEAAAGVPAGDRAAGGTSTTTPSSGGAGAGAATAATSTVPAGAGAGPTAAAPAAASAASTSTSTTRAVEATTTAPAPRGPVRSPAVEADVLPLTNRDRSAEGLTPLSRHGCLDGVASRYAEQMARRGVLAHDPGAGPAVTGCRPGATWGDNVGTAAPCSASLLEERWMASAGHRRNILTAAFRHVGIGAWTDPKGACWVQVLFSS